MEEILDEKSIGKSGSNKVLDNSGRAKAVLITFGVVILLMLLQAHYMNNQTQLLEGILNGNMPSSEEVDANDNMVIGFGMLAVIARLVLIVLFMMWMRRAYANINRSGLETDSKDGETIWTWFIPIYHVYKVPAMLIEIWKKSQEKLKELDSSYIVKTSVILIGFWAVFYWASFYYGVFVNMNHRSAMESRDVVELAEASRGLTFAVIGTITAAIFAVLFVKQISEVETRIYNRSDDLEE